MADIFFISPVRNISPELKERLSQYVTAREAEGLTVHWPLRDTKQDDPVGVEICRTNSKGIFIAPEIHVWYDPSSMGSAFDGGNLFMLMETLCMDKKVVIANKNDVVDVEGKSFYKVLLYLESKK